MMTTEKRQQVFETMPVKRAVLYQIAPSVLSQMVALIYNLADTYFVGLLNEPVQTAAITVATPSFLILTAVSNLFGVGGASVISRALGEKNLEKAREVASFSFWMGMLTAAAFSLLYALCGETVLQICGGRDETLDVAVNYTRMTIVYGGTGTVLNMLLANLLRAEGRAGAASWGVSLGGILNVLLDPFFVLPQFLAMGAAGAGLATALANGAATITLLCCLIAGRHSVLSLSPKLLKQGSIHTKSVLAVGFPAAMQYALTVVATAAQSRFVSQYGKEAVAALGITKKIDMLPLYFSIGVSNGLLPLLAYNYGAGNHRRRRAVFSFGCIVSVSVALLCLVLYELFAPQLVSIFIDDTATVAYAASFLRRMVVAMPLMALCYPMILHFQAMGMARQSLICSIFRKGTLDIPLLFVMDKLFPLYGCMWVQAIVDAVSLIIASGFYISLKKKKGI